MQPVPRGVDFLINSLGGAGAERQVSYLASRIEGSRVIILEDVVVYETSAPVIALGAPPRSTLGKILALPLQFVRLLKALRPGVIVLSMLPRANVLNAMTALVRPHPFVVSERQSLVPLTGTRSLATRLRHAILGFWYRRADLVTANSRGTGDDLVRFFGIPEEKIRIVYNACDGDLVRQRGTEPVDAPRRYLVTSGRLDIQKGQDNLLRAFAMVRKDHADLELVILGTGPEETRLRDLARPLGIADAVRFAGFQKNPFAWIARAEAFVLTSHFEGFPNVVLESLALGTPVVSADCPYGPRELLAPDTDHRTVATAVEETRYGILVPPMIPGWRAEDEPLTAPERLLAEAIARLLDTPSLREHYGVAGRERADALLPERIVQDWEALLAEVRGTTS